MNAWFQLSCLLRESSGLLNQLMNYFDIPTLVLDTHNSTTYKTMNAWFQLSCLLTYSTIKDFNFRASIWIKISLYVDEKKYKSLISVFSSKSVLIYYEHICWGIATKLSSWLLMYCKYLPNSCYIPPKSSDILVVIQNRDANSLAISIPRGFGELGNGNLSFLGDQGNKNLFPGFRVGVRGNFGEYLVSDLKLIWNFFLLKRIFSLFFF